MMEFFQLFYRKKIESLKKSLGLAQRIIKETFSVDLRSLALLRMGLGAILMADLILRALDLRMFYSDTGVLPRAILFEKFLNSARFSLYFVNGNAWFVAMLFFVAFLFAFLLFIGYKTRISTFISWVLLVSLQVRNPLVLNGGDTLLRMLLFWSLFLPLGTKYSLDNAFNKKRDFLPKNFFSAGVTGLFLQVAMAYWFAASFKLHGKSWMSGQAIYYTLNIDQFSTHFGLFLLGFPAILTFLTYFTVSLQIIGPFLLLSPIYKSFFRTLGVSFFVLFHAGIASTLRIGAFPFIGMLSVLAFLPSEFWDYFERRSQKTIKQRLRLYYDSECGFCQKMIMMLKTFLLYRNVEITPAQGTRYNADMEKYNSWIVIDDSGNMFTHFAAFGRLSKNSIILRPISRILQSNPIAYFGKKIYVSISNHRPFFGKFLSFLKPHEYMPHSLLLENSVAITLIAYIFFLNFQTTNSRYTIPKKLMLPAYVLNIDQKWGLFAPEPLKDDGWYVIPGKLKSGKEVDLYQHKETVTWEKPKFVSSMYKTERWRKYMMNLQLPKFNGEARNNFAKYLCREWNEKNTRDEDTLETLEIYYMNETTLPNYQVPNIKQDLLWKHYCLKVPEAVKK